MDLATQSDPPSATSPIGLLSHDPIRLVLGRLPLCEALACRRVCRLFRDALALPAPPALPTLRLLALRASADPPALHAFDPARARWLRLPLAFLPFASLTPITASASLVFLWGDVGDAKKPKSLIACNPLTRAYRVLPQLGSAWPRHGTVLGAPGGAAVVLAGLAALVHSPGTGQWLKFPLKLPSEPRSPVLVGDTLYTLCDVGSPWQSHWKLFACSFRELGRGWAQVERPEWGDVLDILKRPKLISSAKAARILMIGGLRTSYAMEAPCSTVLILRLDLETMEWDEAGRMPSKMYEYFCAGVDNKVKVFGGDGLVWFSGTKARGQLVMWEEEEAGGGGRWNWVDGVPGDGVCVYSGFLFDAGLKDVP